MREAGLPPVYSHAHGETFLLTGNKAVVRAVYPETNQVDIETEDGSFLTRVLVIGPYFPEVHKDSEAPSHVGYIHVRGQAEAFCWPMPHRRLLGPQDQMQGEEGQSQPERRYYHLHHSIFRLGKITVRLTRDDRYVIETEDGDYILLDTQRREIHLHAPTVYLGTTTDQGRVEYEQDDSLRAFVPLVLLGTENEDRIEYMKDLQILMQAPLIKLTAENIVLDPVHIAIGHENATEQLVLGNAWMALYNAFITLFNTHVHTNVQTGGGLSGPPQTGAASMTNAQLSDVAYVSKTGS